MDISLIPKEVMLAWGIPGTLLLIAVGMVCFLFKRLTESQEQRVKEILDVNMKYEMAIDKVHDTMDAILTVLKEKRRVK